MTKARDLANSAAAFASVSATELGYVDGVTSAIQTQMDAKAPSSTAVTLTGTQTLTNKTLTSPALTTPTISTATTNGDILYGTGSGALARLGIGSSANVLTVSGGVPAWAAPAGGGKVLQVVYSETSTDTSLTGTTWTDTGLSASITPTLNTSKILVLTTSTLGVNNPNPATDASGGIRLLRGSTVLQATNTDGGYHIMASTTSAYYGIEMKNSQVVNYLDSPATTSSTTYKIQFAASNAVTIVRTGFDNGYSSMVLMEIGA